MKLMMTADAVGGVWTYALDLARGLRAQGVETVLAVNGPPPQQLPPDIEAVATGLPLDWLATSPAEVADAGRALAALAGAHRVDVVQLNAPAYAAGVRFGVPVLGVHHSCTATWWKAVHGAARRPADFDWRFDVAQRGLLACDRILAPTSAFAATVREVYDLPAPPTAIWNGRAAHPLAAEPDGERYVFTAGRLWDEGKGLATLDAAAALLSTPVEAAGPLRSPGGGEVAYAHLRTTGALPAEALRARMEGAAVFVSPALYEPFGLSVLEAAQAGRPLVLSDIPAFRELWDGAAVFAPPRDAPALATALDALLADPERRAGLGAAARGRSGRYTLAASAAATAGVLRSLLSASRLRSS